MNCVEIKNLTKKFENNVALENINLNLEKGSVSISVSRAVAP